MADACAVCTTLGRIFCPKREPCHQNRETEEWMNGFSIARDRIIDIPIEVMAEFMHTTMRLDNVSWNDPEFKMQDEWIEDARKIKAWLLLITLGRSPRQAEEEVGGR